MKKRVTSVLLSFIILVALVVAIGSDSSAASTGWVWSDTANNWWYETEYGYASNEYRDGYWLNDAGWYDSAWNGSWQSDGNGWWVQSGSWYAADQWLKIDGKWYHFNSSGYMDVNKWIGSDYVGADGAWTTAPEPAPTPAPARVTKYGDTIVTKCVTYGMGRIVKSDDYVKMSEEKVTFKIDKNEGRFNTFEDYITDSKIMGNVNKAIGLKVGDTFELQYDFGEGSKKYVYTILEIK